jgi:hypothetical protein
MPRKSKLAKTVRPHDLQKPKLPAPKPPGIDADAGISQGVELQAKRLVHKAGSVDNAKKMIDAAVGRETASDFREDAFAARWGFPSRAAMMAKSQPLFDSDGSDWWATEIPEGTWVVWGQDDLSATNKFASLAEARLAVGDK